MSSSDAADGYFSSRDSEYDSEDYRHRSSRRGTRRSRSPTHRHHREEYGGASSFFNNANVRALNNLIMDLLAKGETEHVQSLLSPVSALHTNPPVRTPVASSTMQAASDTTQYQSLKPAPTVNTRMSPNEFAALTKFSGTEGDKYIIVDPMDQYEAFAKVSLQSRVGTTGNLIDASLMQFFLYVLKDEAIVFHTQVVSRLVSWRRSADHKLLPDDEAKSVPKSWSDDLRIHCPLTPWRVRSKTLSQWQ